MKCEVCSSEKVELVEKFEATICHPIDCDDIVDFSYGRDDSNPPEVDYSIFCSRCEEYFEVNLNSKTGQVEFVLDSNGTPIVKEE